MGLIIDFAASKPGDQAGLVYEQYKMLTDPRRRPQDYYREAVAAIRAAAADPHPERVLDAAVAKVAEAPKVPDSKVKHYREVSEGFLSAWDPGDSLVSVLPGTFALRSARMRVNPQLGVRGASGDLSAVFLYLKRQPLTKDTVQPFLFAMNEIMDSVLPGARPRILNVRTGEYLDIDRRATSRRQTLRIAGLLGQWTAMWAEVADAA